MAEDTGGVKDAGKTITDANPAYTVLIDQDHLVSKLYNMVNVGNGYSTFSPAFQQATLPIFFCPSRRFPMVSPASQNNGSVNALLVANGNVAGACGDYGCCSSDGTSGNNAAQGANGAMVNSSVLDPSPSTMPASWGGKYGYPGSWPQGPNQQDQPNLNPPSIPLVFINRWSSYTSFKSITAGTSNVLLIGEKHVRQGHFGEAGDGDQAYYSGANHNSAQRMAGVGYPLASGPLDSTANFFDRFGSAHVNFVNFVFCDGSVRAVAVWIDQTNLGRLANRMNGTPVTFQFDS